MAVVVSVVVIATTSSVESEYFGLTRPLCTSSKLVCSDYCRPHRQPRLQVLRNGEVLYFALEVSQDENYV